MKSTENVTGKEKRGEHSKQKEQKEDEHCQGEQRSQ